jgi:branched-subunit amino acid transport protein
MNDSVSIFITILTLFVVIVLDKSKYPWLQKVLEWVPAILFAYIVPAIITHAFHLDLSTVKLHGFSKI